MGWGVSRRKGEIFVENCYTVELLFYTVELSSYTVESHDYTVELLFHLPKKACCAASFQFLIFSMNIKRAVRFITPKMMTSNAKELTIRLAAPPTAKAIPL